MAKRIEVVPEGRKVVALAQRKKPEARASVGRPVVKERDMLGVPLFDLNAPKSEWPPFACFD